MEIKYIPNSETYDWLPEFVKVASDFEVYFNHRYLQGPYWSRDFIVAYDEGIVGAISFRYHRFENYYGVGVVEVLPNRQGEGISHKMLTMLIQKCYDDGVDLYVSGFSDMGAQRLRKFMSDECQRVGVRFHAINI